MSLTKLDFQRADENNSYLKEFKNHMGSRELRLANPAVRSLEELRDYRDRILQFLLRNNSVLSAEESRVWRAKYDDLEAELTSINETVSGKSGFFNEGAAKLVEEKGHLRDMNGAKWDDNGEMLGPPIKFEGPEMLDKDIQQWEDDGGGSLWGDEL